MDKSRDVKRRVAIRFKHSKSKLSSVRSEAKREKKHTKLSSVVGRSNSSHEYCEMESLGTSRDEDELRSLNGNDADNKRFKLSGKFQFFEDCNGVSHASVPRRLRSAMKKRSCDSISPSLPHPKKAKNHVRDVTNSTKMNLRKKSKSNTKRGGSDRCSKRILSGQITKDEEEVAATLFALAELFADKNVNGESKGNLESLEPNSSNVLGSNSCPSALEVAKEHVGSVCSFSAAETGVPALDTERLTETLKAESWTEQNVKDVLSFHLASDDTVSRVTLHSSSAKIEAQCNVKPLCSSVKLSMPSDLHSNAKLKHALEKKALFVESKPETALGMATSIGSQMEPQHKLEEPKEIGLALWPELPSKVARVDDPSLPYVRSSASKLSGWPETACSGSRRRCSFQTDSFAKILKVTADRRLSKRCATHIYISRLIRSLRISEGEDRSSQPQTQSTREGLNQGFSSTTNGVGIVVSGVVSVGSINCAIAKQRSSVAKNGPLQKSSFHDHFQPVSAVSNGQKQIDFFTSLTRDGGIEVNGGSGRVRNGSESSSQLQSPYLPSFSQHQYDASFSLPQSRYNSCTRSDQFSSTQQVQMQIPSYISPLYGTRASPTVQFLNFQTEPTSQQPQQQQQQQYPMTVAPSPYSSGKVMRQYRRLPSIYEDLGGGFRLSPLLPFKFLCDERL